VLFANWRLLSACRAKNIKNQAVVNEDADQRTLLRKYERELRRLRAELTRRNKELVDKRHLLEVRGLLLVYDCGWHSVVQLLLCPCLFFVAPPLFAATDELRVDVPFKTGCTL
jgi:hypothetical protein